MKQLILPPSCGIFLLQLGNLPLLSNKSMDRKHVTALQVKESYLEDAGNLPPAAA